MDKANVISNLRMGIAAGTVVLSGAVNEAEAARPVTNAHPLLSEYAMSGKASITPIEKNPFLANMDSATAQKVLRLTFDKGNLYYLSNNAALDMQEEKQAKKKIREEKRYDRKMQRKNGNKTVHCEYSVSPFKKLNVFGEYDNDSKIVTVNKITFNKDELQNLTQEQLKDVADKEALYTSPAFLESVKVHENHHRESDKMGIDDYGVDVEQHAKLEHHDEIASNTAQLINYREAYQNAAKEDKNAKIEDYFLGPQFQFYIDAANKGKINPLAEDNVSRDKDYAFIINGTQDMWMQKYSAQYSSNLTSKIDSWAVSGASSQMQKDDTKYKKIRDSLYKFEIDGKKVNLSQYRQEDISLSELMQNKVDRIQQKYAPFDKNFSDAVNKNIKTPEDLAEAQAQAKKVLELRGNAPASKNGTNHTPTKEIEGKTFAPNANLFRNQR